MPRPKKACPKPQPGAETPLELFLPVPPAREAADEAVLTTILRIGEALAGPLCQAYPTDLKVTHAVPVRPNAEALAGDFSELREIVKRIAGLRTPPSSLARLMSELPEAFGSENAFPFLFRNLFPVRPPQPQPGPDGKPLLTPREVEILAEVAGDRPHEEVAKRLGIAPSTVNTTLRNIYRKLGVNRPFQAASLAASKGYLHWGLMTHLMADARAYTRGNSELMEDFCLNVCCFVPEQDVSDFDCLAGFGLLLMAVSGAAKRQLYGDRTSKPPPRGAIYEVSLEGKVGQPFGEDRIGAARSITVAPSTAVRHGFLPGNLFVAHDLKPQRNLNRGAISEFTPDGRYVRTFCGSSEVGTRIVGSLSVAFAKDGRLLATSGTWTDVILVFTEEGASVARFVEGVYHQITVDKRGYLYGAQHWKSNGLLRRFDADGQSLAAFGRSSQDVDLLSLAINSAGRMFVGRGNAERRFLDEFDADGQFVRERIIPGYHGNQLAIDAQDRLYLPCSQSGDLKVLDPDCQILHTIALPANLFPCSVAVSPEGRIWVCGEVV